MDNEDLKWSEIDLLLLSSHLATFLSSIALCIHTLCHTPLCVLAQVSSSLLHSLSSPFLLHVITFFFVNLKVVKIIERSCK